MNRRILIVDDSKVERIVLAGFLKNEYDICEASSGEEAVQILTKQYKLISAIILDIVMPGMDGFATVKMIRSNYLFSQVPIIIATSLEDDASRERAIAYGANGFITKPYNQALLKYTVQNAINLRETAIIANTVWKDSLTGLLNREAFFKEARDLIKRHEAEYYVVSCVDIVNFKSINAQYGTDTGDLVLKHVADIINSFVSGFNGRSCHFNADKFAIIYPAKLAETELLRESHRRIKKPECLHQAIRIRIGRYIIDDLSLSVSTMYDRAALAEESLKNRYETYIAYYTKEMHEAFTKEQEIVGDMVHALRNGEFSIWLQPQYNHMTGAMVGAEALVRWKKGDKFISPAEFIPIFEKNGFIYNMDQFVWTEVCSLLRRWLDEGHDPLPVSVNISRRDLQHQHFIETLVGIVDKQNIPYDLLRLEVTESAFADSGIIDKVSELIRLGFTVEIDDFGSGYSSLNTLKDVPATILKLDMKFFENTNNVHRSGNIVESVVRMAKWLNMAVIAEGVEDREQADYLKTIGCYYIQGYYYARPMPIIEYEVLQQQKNKEPKLTRLKTLVSLDNNQFWNPKSMETLIFNSYIGGACILEYHNGKAEVLRINDQYVQEFGKILPKTALLADVNFNKCFDDTAWATLKSTIESASETEKEASCEVKLTNGKYTEYLRITVRIIAHTAERLLCYTVINNMTAQREAERKENETARMLEVVMSNINGGVSVISLSDAGKSKMVFCNDRYYSLFGYTKEQAVAEKLDAMTLIIPEDYQKVLQKLFRLKHDGKPTDFDYCALKRDGSPVYIHCNATIISLDGYDEKLIAWVGLDITEQRRVQDQLRAIIDNINGGVSATYLRDEKPEYVVVNEHYFEIIGYTREQFKEEVDNIFDCIVPEDRERVERQFNEASDHPGCYSMEYRFIRRDGKIINILCNTSVIHFFGLDAPVQLAVSNDITELRESQQKERNTARQMETIIGNINGGVTATVYHDDDNVEIIFANDGFYELYGYTKESFEAEVSNVLDIILPEDRDKTMKTIAQIVNERSSETYEYRCRKRDGSIVWTRGTNTVISLDGVGDTVLIAVSEDITAEKETNLQLLYLNNSAHDILAQPDVEQAINVTLHKLMDYHEADRAYISELNFEKMVASNTYVVCASGVKSEQDNLQEIPFDENEPWYDVLKRNEFFYIENVDVMKEKQSVLHNLLTSRGIHSMMFSPLWRDGRLIGFAGVDNPRRATSVSARTGAFGDYIAVLLTRRDMMMLVEQQQKLVLDNLPCGVVLYEFDGKTLKAVHFNNSYWIMMNRKPMYCNDVIVEEGIFPEDREIVTQEILSAISQKRDISVNVRIINGESEYKPFHVTANVIPSTDGKYLFYSTYTPLPE